MEIIKTYRPDDELSDLFHCVQMANVFSDSKTFVDCTPVFSIMDIRRAFEAQRLMPGFDLAAFVHAHFRLPQEPIVNPDVPHATSFLPHLNNLWASLKRDHDADCDLSSLLPLPHPYVVPGERFRELYYWDTYFTLLGLYASGYCDFARGMIENFRFLIQQYGFIPNGNRSYYLTRSQPPFFAAMVRLLIQFEDMEAGLEYLPELEREYQFWMDGEDALNTDHHACKRVVRLDSGAVLNRYWDSDHRPRAESYREDVGLAEGLEAPDKLNLYRNIRAAAESGWDFSSRWLQDGRSLTRLNTADIVPVDLNCLMYNLERLIADLHTHQGCQDKAERFRARAQQRKAAIFKYGWDEERRFFMDYDVKRQTSTETLSLAGVYPVYFRMATPDQAHQVAFTLRQQFLYPGGLVTTLQQSGQQWDWPNGWAPLQWLAIHGLTAYGHDILAKDIAERWLEVNRNVLRQHGVMAEKYNVVQAAYDRHGGGEYPNQTGFGWTNGVAIALAQGFIPQFPAS